MRFQKNLQGLLPPLVLSALQARFSATCKTLLESVTAHSTRNIHLNTLGRRTALVGKDEVTADKSTSPATLLGFLSPSGAIQAELLAHCLPSCLDLLGIGLELERWTSLVAGSDTSFCAGMAFHSVRAIHT